MPQHPTLERLLCLWPLKIQEDQYVRSITFDGEIVGVWFNMENIIEYSMLIKTATHHTINQHGNGNKNAYSTERS